MNTCYGYPNSFFDELCEMEFEGHKFLASKHYRELLYLPYGPDYMELPPKELRCPHNNATEISFGDIFDDN